MVYSPEFRNRNNNSTVRNRRAIAALLRQGADMVPRGESVILQPEHLNEFDQAWIERGEAEVCLSGLVQKLNVAENVEIVNNDKTPIFIVHK